MRIILLLTLLIISLFAQDTNSFLDNFEFKGDVDLSAQYYFKKPEEKNKDNYTASTRLEMAYTHEDLQIKANIFAQQDYYDLTNSPQETQRSFVRLDELYLQYDMENDQLIAGKTIKFWGALEVRNITDGFNPLDLRSDPFSKDKLGVWNLSFTHYTENGELSFILKGYEQGRAMSAYPYVYYFFPKDINTPQGAIPLVYDDTLITQEGSMRPSYYISYSGSTDTTYPLDYAVIFENGYDSQRYYSITPNDPTLKTQENAYIVNKISTYNTLVIDNTLYKLEALYADVQKSDENNVSSYFHLGIGVEHTLTQIYKEADLGFIGEYYYYDTLDSDKKTDLELFETFQNDLFLGLRYSFNQGDDASVVGGAIIDLDYNEQVYYFEYESRIADTIKLNFDYRYIQPSKHTLTAFHLMGQHERISLKLGYYF